jgi:hypothetical protein
MSAVVVDGGRHACDSPSLAPEVLNKAADILYPPRPYSRAEFDRLRKRTRLHLPPEDCRGTWEDRGDELRLEDVACFAQCAERVGIVWHVATVLEGPRCDIENARARSRGSQVCINRACFDLVLL